MKIKLAIIGIFSICLAFAQATKSKLETKGDKLYFIFAYNEAIKKYEKVLKKDSLTTDGLRKLADSYVKTAQYGKAEAKYSDLVQVKDVTPNDVFNYTNILKTNGKYKESDEWMKKYFELAPNEIRSKTNQQLMDKVSKLKVDQGLFEIKESKINSSGQEFGPQYFGDKIVYAANGIREEGMIIQHSITTGASFLDLFVFDPKDTSSEKIEFKPKFNRKFHEGVVSFSGDKKRMYFTANSYEGKDSLGSYNLGLYWTDLKEDGEWSEPISFEYNNVNYSVGHPSISKDGQTLFFVSNMPGGYGGTDIYKTTMTKNGVWGKPINLGPHINSEGEELFPYYHDSSKMLFYSSNGSFGLGGLDILVCYYKDGVFGKVNNFGVPLNSQYDDFGITIDDSLKMGYFSSNRPNGHGQDDIYDLKILKEIHLEEYELEKRIDGIVKNVQGKPIPSAKIEIFDKDLKSLKTIVAKKDGTFSFIVKENHDYTITSAKEFYLNDTVKVNTTTEDLVVNTVLTMEVKEEIVMVDNVAFIKVQTIYFDYGSAELRPDTKDKLDNVIRIMNENPAMEVEIGSHTDCRGTAKYNMKLSQARANSTMNYIKQRISKPERIYGVGYGESQLVSNCPCEKNVESTCSEEEHQMNRRTEFKIVTKPQEHLELDQNTQDAHKVVH